LEVVVGCDDIIYGVGGFGVVVGGDCGFAVWANEGAVAVGFGEVYVVDFGGLV
jgi:hypothetical protein